jgi:hypothetical protein
MTSATTMPEPGAADESRALLNAFDALDQSEQDAVVEKLLALWDAFTAEFGGRSGFSNAPRDSQDAYIKRFEEVAERSRPVRDTEHGYYYYSVALMLNYLKALRDGDERQGALDLAVRIASLVDQHRSTGLRQELLDHLTDRRLSVARELREANERTHSSAPDVAGAAKEEAAALEAASDRLLSTLTAIEKELRA